jgi:prepilin-type N-terminal cleavage/methylation domain-containing protein
MGKFLVDKKSVHRQSVGFTIVELLIVIVVIGILAAITIVAYNGVQNRARASAASSAATQAVKKLESFAVDGNGYPATLAAVGVLDSGTTSYQYTVDNSVIPATYCVTVTNGTTSYTVSSTNTRPTAGGCAGHGQGGVAAVTNMAVNPSMASTANINSAGAAGSNAVVATGGFSGPSFIRRTFSAAGGAGLYFNPVTTITPGTTYTASVYTRSSVAASIRMNIEWKTSSSIVSSSGGTSVTVGPGGWTRISASGTAPATADRVTLTAYASGSPWVAGDYQDIDAGMFTEGGNLTNYADGDSPNWVWNGTANNATSTGPPL